IWNSGYGASSSRAVLSDELVGRYRNQHQYSGFQWISVHVAGERSFDSRSGSSRTDSRSAGQNRTRCADLVVGSKHRIPEGQRDGGTTERSRSWIEAGADEIPDGTE